MIILTVINKLVNILKLNFQIFFTFNITVHLFSKTFCLVGKSWEMCVGVGRTKIFLIICLLIKQK